MTFYKYKMNEYRKQLGYVGMYVLGFIVVTFVIVSLISCGPTILSVGILDVTAGDVVTSGAKYKLLNDDN